MKICVICGAEFKPAGRYITCSYLCSIKNYAKLIEKHKRLARTGVRCPEKARVTAQRLRATIKRRKKDQAIAKRLKPKLKPAHMGGMTAAQIERRWDQLCEGVGL